MRQTISLAYIHYHMSLKSYILKLCDEWQVSIKSHHTVGCVNEVVRPDGVAILFADVQIIGESRLHDFLRCLHVPQSTHSARLGDHDLLAVLVGYSMNQILNTAFHVNDDAPVPEFRNILRSGAGTFQRPFPKFRIRYPLLADFLIQRQVYADVGIVVASVFFDGSCRLLRVFLRCFGSFRQLELGHGVDDRSLRLVCGFTRNFMTKTRLRRLLSLMIRCTLLKLCLRTISEHFLFHTPG